MFSLVLRAESLFLFRVWLVSLRSFSLVRLDPERGSSWCARFGFGSFSISTVFFITSVASRSRCQGGVVVLW